MKIGISGPILIDALKEFLNELPIGSRWPEGLGGTAVNLIVSDLLRRGFDVVVFTLDPAVRSDVILSGPRLRICIGPYRPKGRHRALDFFGAERKFLQKSIKSEKPDIVHAHWTYEFALGALASGIPTLVTVRDWAPTILRLQKNYYRFFRFLMDRKVFHRAEALSTISPYVQKLIEERWKKKATLIPNPIEEKFFRTEQRNFIGERTDILAIGNGIGRLKNLKSLLRAFFLIKEKLPGCRLKLIGEGFGPYGPAYTWTKKNFGCGGIDYLGKLSREKISLVLDESSLLVHPSLEESFGNVIAEAMARRVPVLGGECSGAVPWLLDFGKAGGLCNVRDPRQIAEAAVDIISSPERWNKLSNNGFHRVKSLFSLSRIVDLYLAEYENVLSRHGT